MRDPDTLKVVWQTTGHIVRCTKFDRTAALISGTHICTEINHLH